MGGRDRLREIINRNLRDYFDPMRKHHIDVVALNSGNTLEHELKKFEICYKLKSAGHTVITEGILKSGLRPDVVVLDVSPPLAYEIMCSEGQKSIDNKKRVYPFPVMEVHV